MPKVPVYNQRQVAPVSRPGYQPASIQADYTLARGIEGLKEGVNAVGGAVIKEENRLEEERAKAKAEAEAMLQSEALLEQQKRFERRWRGDSSMKGRVDDAFEGVDTTTGLMSMKGREALNGSVATLEALDKDQKELEERFVDPEARRRFRARAEAQKQAYRRDIETHADKEGQLLDKKTLDDRKQALFDSSATGTPETYLSTAADLEEDVRRKEGDAGVIALRKEAALNLVAGLVAQGREADADKFLEERKDELGQAYIAGKKLVTPRLEASKKERALGEMRDMVDDAANRAKERATGVTRAYATEEEIRAAVPDEGYDEASRAAKDHFLQQAIAREKQRKQADIQEERNNALRADGQTMMGNRTEIPQFTSDFLWEHDPDFMRGLMAQRLARQKAAAHGNSPKGRAEQKQIDMLYRNRYASLPREEQQRISPEEYAVTFADEMAQDGVAATPSALGVSFAGKVREDSRRQLEKGLDVQEDKFVDDFTAEARKILKKKGKPTDEKMVQDMAAAARMDWREWYAKNNGMDKAAEDELGARLRRKAILEPGTRIGWESFGITIGEKEGLDAQRPRAPQPKPTIQQSRPPASGKVPPPPKAPPGPGDSWLLVKDKKTGAMGYLAASKLSAQYEQVKQ
jgi:hypothetical protein